MLPFASRCRTISIPAGCDTDSVPEDMVSPWFRTDFTDPPSAGWELYDSVGHAGWGLRRPAAISVVDDPTAGNGRALRITASMGEGPADGLLVSGGLKLLGHSRTYGVYRTRVRMDPDPDEATSAVALLWPASNRWPDDGEINYVETWGSRATRSPIESHLHWGAPDPAAPSGPPVDTFTSITHDIDGTAWHTYTLRWAPDRVTVGVDDGPEQLLCDDPARIPHRPMDPTFQLDAFDTPTRPGLQPTIGGRVSFHVDYLEIHAPTDHDGGRS